MSFKGYLETTLKETPLFNAAKIGYHLLVGIRRRMIRSYVSFINTLLPLPFRVQSIPSYVIASYKDFIDDERNYDKNWPDTQKDGTRIITTKYLLDIVNKLPEGHYAELGTYKGAFAHLIFKYMDPKADLYCFDTFEGFASKDVNIELSETGDKVRSGYFSDTSLGQVSDLIIAGSENRKDKLHLIKGYFPDTFTGLENKKWRFVLLDADLYEPMKNGMELFWDNIVDGGVLMIHDYIGSYAGSYKAAEEFFGPRGIVVIPVADRAGSAFVIKQNCIK
jgi:O-methyltransferase